MTRLTIAIPTYNRPAQLAGTISRLLPQLTPEVEIVVLDNHSTEPLDAVLAPLFQPFKSARFQIIRHPANIGGNANIIRCLEVGSGDWIWTLSDDDEPATNAVASILSVTTNYREAACINFATSIKPRTESFTADSTSSLIERMDSFGNLLFITANVYHRNRTKPYIQLSLAYLHSCAAQVMPYLAAVRDAHTVVLSNCTIARFVPPAIGNGWPSYYFFYFYEIIEILPDIDSQKKLAHLIDAAVITLRANTYLRWGLASQTNNPDAPSALHYIARGAWVRSQYASGLIKRCKWKLISWGATWLHLNHSRVIVMWKAWHQIRYGKPLVIKVMSEAYFGHTSRRNRSPDL